MKKERKKKEGIQINDRLIPQTDSALAAFYEGVVIL
jgi:hypothetical protein